jgi:hypothetical protein
MHPFAVGVTVILADIGAVELLVAINAGMLPDPLAGRPMAVLLFVQEKVVPVIDPDNDVSGALSPSQNT